MTYHTNHCWCSKSIYDGKHFDGEVMVIFSGDVSNNFIDNNDIDIDDFDFERLTEEKKFFDQSSWDFRLDYYKEKAEKKGKVFNESDYDDIKHLENKKTVSLKQEVVDWLNENIEDNKGTTQDTPENERKAWGVGNDEYNSAQSYRIHVFFARQKDALKFIERWSIYKKPTYYFDYFHDESREMDIKKVIKKTNKYRKSIDLDPIDIGDKINIPHKLSTDLNEETFTMIDWENDDFE